MSEFSDRYNQKNLVYKVSDKRRDRIFELLGSLKPGMKILDVGCGNGYLGALLKKHGCYVAGVDIARDPIEEAQTVLDKADVCDIQNESLPFRDGEFDMVVCTEVIEHLLFPEAVLKEIHRILKLGGFAVFTTPNFLVWTNRIKMFLGKFQYTDTGLLDRGHVHFFTLISLEKMLSQNGFKVERFNNVRHGRIANLFGNLLPGLFAFQFVVKANKE